MTDTFTDAGILSMYNAVLNQDIPVTEVRRLKGLVSDGTHNDKIETYKRFVTMLSSYKLLDEEHLNKWTKNDGKIDNSNNDSANKRRRSIRTLRQNYQHQAKVGNQLTILADLFNQD